MTHNDLIKIGREWLIKPYCNLSDEYGHSGCSVVLTELCAHTKYGEQPDILGFCTGKSILIECKTSLSDFFADQKKVVRKFENFGIGSQRWYLAPEGIIPVEKVPEKWGLLEVTPNRKIKVSKRPVLQERDFQSEINMLISTMRRLNILPDDHVAIKKYTPLQGFAPSKKASFYIQGEEYDTK
jgi:Holliday junction resolvase